MTNLALVRADAADLSKARRERIDALSVDRRSAMRHAQSLPPVPPEAERAEQWLTLLRESNAMTRLEALRALLALPSPINPRPPLVRR
jgi:hypothetical protein